MDGSRRASACSRVVLPAPVMPVTRTLPRWLRHGLQASSTPGGPCAHTKKVSRWVGRHRTNARRTEAPRQLEEAPGDGASRTIIDGYATWRSERLPEVNWRAESYWRRYAGAHEKWTSMCTNEAFQCAHSHSAMSLYSLWLHPNQPVWCGRWAVSIRGLERPPSSRPRIGRGGCALRAPPLGGLPSQSIPAGRRTKAQGRQRRRDSGCRRAAAGLVLEVSRGVCHTVRRVLGEVDRGDDFSRSARKMED